VDGPHSATAAKIPLEPFGAQLSSDRRWLVLTNDNRFQDICPGNASRRNVVARRVIDGRNPVVPKTTETDVDTREIAPQERGMQ